MQPSWHLATSSLARRKRRTGLLVLSVTLATSLIVAAGTALHLCQASLELAVTRITGSADIQVVGRFRGLLQASLATEVASWPEVVAVAPHARADVTLRNERTGQHTAGAETLGVVPDREQALHPRDFLEGRMLAAPDETAIDTGLAGKLDLELGETLLLRSSGARPGDEPTKLTVVGIFDRPTLAVLQQRVALVHLSVAQQLGGTPDLLHSLDLALAPGVDVDAFTAARLEDLPGSAEFRSVGSARQDVKQTIAIAQLMLLLVTVLVNLSAGFIILTSLTTAVTQQQRELGMLMCIGTPRRTLAMMQVWIGTIIAGGGAALGACLGLALAYVLYRRHSDLLVSGFEVGGGAMAVAAGSAILAGMLGALYPAWRAARISPLGALTVGGRVASPRALWMCLLLAALLLSVPLALLGPWLPLPPERMFWAFILAGLPALLVGYFLLGPPLLAVLLRLAGRPLAWLLRVPADLLVQSTGSTPIRHGLTGAALMVSLALLIAIWSSGRSVLAGWFDNLAMPDVFVHNYYSLTDEQAYAISQVPGVAAVCPTTAFPVYLAGATFGVTSLGPRNALFVSADIDAFLEMTDLAWIEGDIDVARRKIARGKSLIVSREYRIAHGIGVGSTLHVSTARGVVDFEVVGVVASTGLDLAVGFFGIRGPYTEAAVSAIFGTREDAAIYFGNQATNLVLLKLEPDAQPGGVVRAVRRIAPTATVADSHAMRRFVHAISARLMAVASTIALVTLVIACAGVANMMMATLGARRYEFGVLRATGTPRFMLARLILAETLLIVLVGCIGGTAMGMHLAWSARVLRSRLMGMEYPLLAPWDMIVLGAAIVATGAILAAALPVIRLLRTPPRELLASPR